MCYRLPRRASQLAGVYNGGDPDGDPPKPKVFKGAPVKYNLLAELKATMTTGANVLESLWTPLARSFNPTRKKRNAVL